MKTAVWQLECALANFLNYRRNIIIPNIGWGLHIHECDLFLVTTAGYTMEIEIKTSQADIVNDKRKKRGHYSNKIKYLYFAIPCNVKYRPDDIPQRAGIILVDENDRCIIKRKAIPNPTAKKLSTQDLVALARLGAMRIWNLKEMIRDRWYLRQEFKL